MNITKPIPIPNINKQKKIKSYCSSYSSQSSSLTESYDLSFSNNYKSKTIVLKGTPFINKETIKTLLVISIPSITFEQASKIINEASIYNKANIITCEEKKALLYYSHLVENGLIVEIE